MYRRRAKEVGDPIIIVASGLVLGESLVSIVNLTLEALNVPRFE